jgi:hypothetical protein
MPAYTLGLLAPVPFVWAVAKQQGGTALRWITGIYGAVWLAAFVVAGATDTNNTAGSVVGGVFIALAAVCTTHAFVLRQSLRTAGALPPPPPTAPDATRTMIGQSREAVSSLTSRVTAHAAALPPTAKQLFDDTISQAQQVISFVTSGGHADAQLRAVHAMLTDYLPTSIDGYLRLPHDFATTQRNPDGRTAAEELQVQLQLLRDSATETARSIYTGDALDMETQSAFLQSKFGKSELDLPDGS